MKIASIQLISFFIVLSIMGIFNSSYLIWAHHKKKPLVCPLDHDCSVVTESRWSSVFFVRNEILGLLFFAVLLAGILASIFISSLDAQIFLMLLAMASSGLLFSIFLVFIQFYAIKDYCFYCIASALITLLIFLNSLLLYFD